MDTLITLIRLLGPMLLRGAEAGTLGEIVETAIHLVTLLNTVVADPATQARLEAVGDAVSQSTGLRPAQPDDPVFARQGASHFGGR